MAVKEHVLPRHQHIVEDDQCIDLVEAVGERVIGGAGSAGKARAAEVLDPRRPHFDDAADRVIRQLLVGPAGDCRLQERLVGVGCGGLVFGAAQDDPGIGFPDDMHHHVGVLILRALRAVALWIGIGRDVKNILLQHPTDVPIDIVAKARIDLV